jgi:hypothetical protein
MKDIAPGGPPSATATDVATIIKGASLGLDLYPSKCDVISFWCQFTPAVCRFPPTPTQFHYTLVGAPLSTGLPADLNDVIR